MRLSSLVPVLAGALAELATVLVNTPVAGARIVTVKFVLLLAVRALSGGQPTMPLAGPITPVE